MIIYMMLERERFPGNTYFILIRTQTLAGQVLNQASHGMEGHTKTIRSTLSSQFSLAMNSTA